MLSFFWLRWGLANFLPRLAWNHSPPELCLLSIWDYRCESAFLVTLHFNFCIEGKELKGGPAVSPRRARRGNPAFFPQYLLLGMECDGHCITLTSLRTELSPHTTSQGPPPSVLEGPTGEPSVPPGGEDAEGGGGSQEESGG
jgi:hypothetical protein